MNSSICTYKYVSDQNVNIRFWSRKDNDGILRKTYGVDERYLPTNEKDMPISPIMNESP